MKKKAQSSLEFLMILGIALTIILILAGIFVNYSNTAKKGLDKQQITSLGEELISNIEKVYFLGNGNRVTQRSNFPQGIFNFTIEHLNISNGTQYNQFEVINISFFDDGNINELIFYPSEPFIRLSCDVCSQTSNVNGNFTSYFSESAFSQGPKQLRIEARNDLVYISFTR